MDGMFILSLIKQVPGISRTKTFLISLIIYGPRKTTLMEEGTSLELKLVMKSWMVLDLLLTITLCL